MIKKLIFSLILTTFLSLALFFGTAEAQNTQPPVESFPEYIVKPSEDLNPYGLSSLDNTTGNDYREGQGSLGTKTSVRPSNVEVNKKMDAKNEEKAKENDKKSEQAEIKDIAPQQNTQPAKSISSSGKGAGKMIKWVDSQGVVHITNNIGSVPAEYRNSIKY